MIPTIGIMIGLYIITRMLRILAGNKPSVIVSIAAIVTILAAIFGVVDLFITSGAGTRAGLVP